MGKLADDFRSKLTHAHPDQRPEISLLGLFSYDRFSIVPPEKGWILPLESYPDKLVRPLHVLQYTSSNMVYMYQSTRRSSHDD